MAEADPAAVAHDPDRAMAVPGIAERGGGGGGGGGVAAADHAAPPSGLFSTTLNEAEMRIAMWEVTPRGPLPLPLIAMWEVPPVALSLFSFSSPSPS